MSSASQRIAGASSRLSILLSAAVAAALVLAPLGVHAQEQDKDQQACINKVLKAAAKLAKAQSKESDGCLKASQKGDTTKLGTTALNRNADACLTNDLKGKLDKAQVGILTAIAECPADPDFGINSAGIDGAATGPILSLAADIFGPNLDQPWRVLAKTDSAAAKCQSDLNKNAGKVFNTVWKTATKTAKDALAGKSGTPPVSGLEFGTAIENALTTDSTSPDGKIAKAAAKMLGAEANCGATAQNLLALARGRCASADAGDLAACSTAATLCQSCRSINGGLAIDMDCDNFDDGVANGSCPGFVDAHVITDSGDLIEGPLADGTLGDIIMQNDVARFIIQKGGVRDMYSVGAFGGNIIDAELIGNEGLDNFLEIQPAINMETVVNATTVEIVNDGSNGAPAVVRACGPDDILDFVNPSVVIEDAGFDFPASADDIDQDVDACTEYTLEADATYLKMVTTVFNNAGTVTRSYVGDYVNPAGEVEQWASGSQGIGIQLTADNMGVLSFIGYGEAEGVDYGITTIDTGSEATSYFSTSGVTYIMHSQSVVGILFDSNPQPFFSINPGSSRSFTRYFGVGDGSGANMVNLANLVKGTLAGEVSGCVTVGGAPAPGARVTAGPVDGGAITTVAANWTTGADGCFWGTLAEGTYGMSAWKEGAPYEGDGSTPTLHSVVVASGSPATQDFALPATGSLSVSVTDENSDPVPARISIVGFDPSPEQKINATGVHRDQEDTYPFGIVRALYTDATGNVTFDIEPGSYQLYVSRGPEYSAFSTPITVVSGANAPVAAEIARVIDTSDFVSSDHHVHAIASADSRVSTADRIRQFAGEGVDNIIMTEHHAHTDLAPQIVAMGFADFVTSTIGEEITTWDTGHYNAYPLTVDATRPSGGSTDWGGAAPAGEDFGSLGNYILEPSEIYALATTGPNSTADTVIQINHITDHFVPMQIDTSAVPPVTNLDAAGRTRFRLDPAGGNLFHQFDALELWNGNARSHQNQFLNDRIGVWFNHLNQGMKITMITDTDTHKFTNLESAGGRSWSASSTDDPIDVDSGEIAQSVAAGRVVGGQGVYVQTRLEEDGNPSNEADLTLSGDTTLVASGPVTVNLEIDVQAPLWAEFDRILVYANAATSPRPAPNEEMFSATPTVTLVKGVDFTVTTNNVEPGVPGGSRLETQVVVPFAGLADDTWFVVVVKGTDGVSKPMFPVFPADLLAVGNTTLANLIDGNLGQNGVMALGVTNALYADVDGNPGFDAPLAP